MSNAEINRELATLKRMFTLALQAEKISRSPYIPMLEERNTRKGFFELEQLATVLRHLPAALRPVIEFGYITGWRIPSEVLTLQWHQVDFDAGEVRLEPETTKNRDGRVFPLTDDLRALLKKQDEERERLKKAGNHRRQRVLSDGLGGHPKPAIDRHLKTGHFLMAVDRDVDRDAELVLQRRHGERLGEKSSAAGRCARSPWLVAAPH